MKIAIIGSGNVGGALAQALVKAGHDVTMGSKIPLSDKSKKLAAIIGEDRFKPLIEAVSQAEVLIISTPPEAVLQIIPQLGDVSNKTIIDTTNSVRTRPEPYPTAFAAIQALAKTNKVVKCFNTTGFENLLNPQYPGRAIDMFVAGSDPDSKQTAIRLAKDIGFADCHDFGGDDKVLLLEQFALCWINLAIMQGKGRDMAFCVLKRAAPRGNT